VREGTASQTARGVAAHRLSYERGEPARTVRTADAAEDLLASAGWTPAPLRAGIGGERQRSVGLLLARAGPAPG
jgi:hypothetical protein